jgi:branched-chain amino acid transport system ATP-binding protein
VSRNLALKVSGLDVHYGDFQALWNVSLEVEQQQVVSIIGANGAGKSTLLNSISGLSRPTRGSIEFFGKRMDGLAPHETLGHGISLVPEGRRVFARMTIYENLVMGAYTPRARASRDKILDDVHQLFPVLKARHSQMADTLSGGEQQMLAIGRALMSEPKLVLCDEISLGLAPLIIRDIYKRLRQINREGLTIVLVEQDIKRSLKAAHQAYIMLKGKVVLEGEPSSLTEDRVREAYFGV